MIVLANPLNWLKALWRLDRVMTVLLILNLAVGFPLTLYLNYGTRPLSSLLLGEFIVVAFWIALMFLVAAAKRGLKWLWDRRRDPPILKGTSSVWSVMLSILGLLAVVWLIALNITDPIWRWSVAAIGTVACFASPGGLSCLYWLFSPRFRKQWSKYRRGGPPPGGPDMPEPIRVPRKQVNAAVGGAGHAFSHLPDVAQRARARLQMPDQPITQEDINELVRVLTEAKTRINNNMQQEIDASKDAEDQEWDQAGYAATVIPFVQMANTPQTIVDLAVAAINGGAKSAEFVYKLMISEIEVAVARFAVKINSE